MKEGIYMRKRIKHSNAPEGTNPRLKKLILEVVDNQLRDNNPPGTRETLERLIADGDSRQKAKERIAAVVVEHIYDILHDHKAFDLEKYEQDLRRLE